MEVISLEEQNIMKNTVLMVVDVQNAIMEGKPHNEAYFIQNLQKLIANARESDIEVVYIQHDGKAGSPLEKNSKGWEIYGEIAPKTGEKVFNKIYNSSFKETGLHEYLQGRGVGSIILTGMATEFCIDTTCKVAFEHGYDMIIPKGATTTFGNEIISAELMIEHYEEKVWNGRFAKVVSIDEVMK